ncbi:hypothetical protein MBLNU459_g6931t1 [Dothideomycetes sp. NU459]
MGLVSNGLNLFGIVLLIHAVYSAHEHSLLPAAAAPPSSSSSASSSSSSSSLASPQPTIDLPLDITLETLLSVLLLCLGVVLGSPALKPIQWRVWAGRIERDRAAKDAPLAADGLGPRGNPYMALEERPGFLDIRGKRREFAQWVREGEGS